MEVATTRGAASAVSIVCAHQLEQRQLFRLTLLRLLSYCSSSPYSSSCFVTSPLRARRPHLSPAA